MVQTMLGPAETRTTKHLLLRLIETEDRGLEVIRSLGVTPEEIRQMLSEGQRQETFHPMNANPHALGYAIGRALRKLLG